MSRYIIACFLFASFLSGCKNHSKPSLIGKWRLTPYSYDSSSRKQYFEFDNGKLFVTTVYLDSIVYIKSGDTLFSKNVSHPKDDTTIIELLNADTAIVRNRHGGEDFYIVREKNK